MAYEAELKTDRTQRRQSKIMRLGWNVYSILRTGSEDAVYRTEVHTAFQGQKVSFGLRLYQGNATVPEQDLILLNNVPVSELLNGKSGIRRTPTGAALPQLLPGEPDLLD